MFNIPFDRENMLVVCDYETSGLHADDGAYPSTLGLKWGDSPSEQAAIPIDQGVLDKPGATPTLFGDAPNINWAEWVDIHRWMLKQHLIAHNAKADLWFAWAGLRPERTTPRRNTRADLGSAFHWDTMVVEALLRPGQRVSLDLVAEREGWNEPYREADRRMKAWTRDTRNRVKRQIRYDLAPWDLLEPYLTADLERTWKLYHLQRQLINEGAVPKELVTRELALVRTLFDMERRGLPYDVDRSLAAMHQATAEMEQIARQLPFDCHNKASTVAWLQTHSVRLGVTDTGAYSVDQATIRRAVEQGVPGALDYQRWSKLQTASGLWYFGWAARAGTDKRVRADYRQVKTWEGNNSSGTVSGRFAVSRVQVQAIPSRYQIPEGYPAMQDLIQGGTPFPVWEADISQAEMRVAATLASCTPMLDGFRQGFDAHDSTTQLIWGIDQGDPEWNKRRAVAKRLGFGVIYGAGIRTLAEQIKLFTGEDLGEQGVRDLWDQYRAAFPELFRFSRKIKNQVERRGYLVLPGGKLRVFYPGEPTHKAFNAMIQGAVAVGMTEAMLTIERHAPGVMVGQVHDSVILETEDESVANLCGQVITHTFEDWFPGCPFPTEVKRYDSK